MRAWPNERTAGSAPGARRRVGAATGAAASPSGSAAMVSSGSVTVASSRKTKSTTHPAFGVWCEVWAPRGGDAPLGTTVLLGKPSEQSAPGVRYPAPMTTPAPGHDTVLVLDFGAQYAQLIARRIRECHVFSEVVACDVDPETVRAHDAKALILSGGPKSVYEPGAPALDPRLLELGIPVLGLCYGQQAMAQGPRRPGRGDRGQGVRPHHPAGPARGQRAVRRPARRPGRVDEPRRHGHRRRRPAPGSWPAPTPPRWPRSRTPSGACTGSSSTPRSPTPSGAWTCSRTSSTRRPAAGPTGPASRSSRSRRRPSGPGSATARCSAPCRAGSTPRWPPCSSTGRSGTS